MTQIVTVLYFCESELRLRDQVLELDIGTSGRVEIPPEFKQGKHIMGVLKGKCRILSRMGDRVMPLESDIQPSESAQVK